MEAKHYQEGDVIQEGPYQGFTLLSAYTRKQAIEDGVIIPASELFPSDCRMYKYPVDVTDTVFNLIMDACAADVFDGRREAAADEKPGEIPLDAVGAYVWDLCYMSINAVIARPDPVTVIFKCQLPLSGNEADTRKFKAVCGPTDIDDPRPKITIMMEDED